jgi:hypothetical protein
MGLFYHRIRTRLINMPSRRDVPLVFVFRLPLWMPRQDLGCWNCEASGVSRICESELFTPVETLELDDTASQILIPTLVDIQSLKT